MGRERMGGMGREGCEGTDERYGKGGMEWEESDGMDCDGKRGMGREGWE